MAFHIKSRYVKRPISLYALTFDLNSGIFASMLYGWSEILQARDFGINKKFKNESEKRVRRRIMVEMMHTQWKFAV